MFRDYNSSYHLDISITNLPRVCESLFTFFSMVWTVYLREKLVDFVRWSEEKESHIIIKKGTLQVLKKKEMALAGGLLTKKLTIKNDKTTFNEVRTYFLGKRYLSTDSSSPSWSLPCWTKMEINLIFWKEKREREKSGPFRKRLKGIERLHSIAFRADISNEEGSTQRYKVNLLDSLKFAYAPAHCKYIGHLKNKFLFQQNKTRCQ